MKFLTIILLFGFLFSKTTAKVIHVGNSFSIKSIKYAVEVAQPFDSLIIHSGIYREGNIIVSKSISLIGEGNPVLDGEHKFELLTVSGNKFRIVGLKFINSGYSSMNDFALLKSSMLLNLS
jgi:nitrous oxidase accessory protein